MPKEPTIIQEPIVQEGIVVTRPGILAVGGKGILTPQHFYFQARGAIWLNLFGIPGILLRMVLPMKIKIDIPLSSVTAVGLSRPTLAREVFFFETLEGKKYQFGSASQFWLDILKDTVQRQTGTILIQTDQTRWQVPR